ncbi:ribonuclease H-like domain-containing protein [Tanacetum coccineum]
MVTRFHVGSNRPPERLNLHMSSISPLPKSYTDAFNDLNWQNCLADDTLSRYKARLVANGSTQSEGIDVDETFSLVVKLSTIQTILCLATSRRWPVHQLDVKNAFLHGDLSKTVYMHQSLGFWDSAHPDYHIIASLHQEFSMTDLGSLNYFFGIFVTHDSSGMFLSQHKYAAKILERAHMANCNPSWTPINTEYKLGDDGDPVSDLTFYRSLEGSLQYLTFTCPNISYAVQQLHTPLSSAMLVYCDNVSAVYLSSNLVQHQPTKYIEIDIHFVQDLVAAVIIARLCLSGCHYGGGNGFTKTSLITHLRDRHCNGDAHTHTLCDRCRHGEGLNFVRPPDYGDGEVRLSILSNMPPPCHIPIDHHQLIASHAIVLDMIKSFPRGTSCRRDGLRAQNLMDCLSGVVVAISDELISYITQVMNLFLDVKCLQMLVEYIISALSRSWSNRGVVSVLITYLLFTEVVSSGGGCSSVSWQSNQLIDRIMEIDVVPFNVRIRCPTISHWVEFCYSNPSRLYYGEHTLRSYQGVQQGNPLGPLLFALVLHPLLCKIRDSFNLSLQAWYLDDGTIIGDSLVTGEALKVIVEDGPRRSLHLNVDKTEVFLPMDDTRSSADFDFSSELVMKRVAKSIQLMDDWAQHSFDASLHSALERIVTASGLRFGEWQWRLSTLPFAFGGLGVYSDFTMCVMLSLGVPLFPARKPCSACSRVFARDIYGDRVVLCVAGKEVDIGVGRGQDKPLRPADILLYSWDRGIDILDMVFSLSNSLLLGNLRRMQ